MNPVRLWATYGPHRLFRRPLLPLVEPPCDLFGWTARRGFRELDRAAASDRLRVGVAASARQLGDGLVVGGLFLPARTLWALHVGVQPAPHDKTILICSEASLTSWWVDREIETSLQEEERLWKERGERIGKIIPIAVDGFWKEWDGTYASTLKARRVEDFSNWSRNARKSEDALERLVTAMRADDAARPPDPTPKL